MSKWLALAVVAGLGLSPMALATGLPRETFFTFQQVLDQANGLEDLFPYLSQRAREDMAALPNSAEVSDKVFALMRFMGRVQNGVVVTEDIQGASADLVVEGTGSEPAQGRAVKVQTQVVLREESGEWKIDRIHSRALAP